MQRKPYSLNFLINAKRSCYYRFRSETHASVVAESLAVPPVHVTPSTPQDTGTLHLASYFPPATGNFVHPKIPVSERCLDNATRVNYGGEPSSSSVSIPGPFQHDPYFNSQPTDNILSTGMTYNPCQSYVRYTNSDQSCDLTHPSSSTGSLSMPVEYSEEWDQPLEWLDSNSHSSIPQSILTNHDADNSYNDIMIMAYAEFIGTAPITLMTITDRLS